MQEIHGGDRKAAGDWGRYLNPLVLVCERTQIGKIVIMVIDQVQNRLFILEVHLMKAVSDMSAPSQQPFLIKNGLTEKINQEILRKSKHCILQSYPLQNILHLISVYMEKRNQTFSLYCILLIACKIIKIHKDILSSQCLKTSFNAYISLLPPYFAECQDKESMLCLISEIASNFFFRELYYFGLLALLSA